MDLTFQGSGRRRTEQPRLDPPHEQPVASPRRRERAWQVAVVVALALAVAARFVALSHLWLDEALTVNIARLPLGDIPEALRHDGAPPLYYFLLHGWMEVFGSSTMAVRALSGLFSVAALPLAFVAGRRLGGRRVAWAALLLLAASPFGIRLASEARMYSMVTVLVLLGFLAAHELLTGGPRRRVAAVALGVVTGLLLLTHYWSFYLGAAALIVFAVAARRGHDPARTGGRLGLLSVGVGALAFLPWLPSFIHQLRHTGTPWGAPGGVRSVLEVIAGYAGGELDPSVILGLLFLALIPLAVFAHPLDGPAWPERSGGRGIVLESRPRAPASILAGVAFGALALGILAGVIGGSAFAVRYTAVVFPLVVLLVGLGADVFAARRVHAGVIGLAVVLGLWASVPIALNERTSAGRVASLIEAGAQPGDIVVYCPDQLGPSVSRELDTPGLVQLTFPRATAPELVDWVDYADVNRAAKPLTFGRDILDRAGPESAVWVVWANGYRTFSTKCRDLVEFLGDERPAYRNLVSSSTRYFERPGLTYFPA